MSSFLLRPVAAGDLDAITAIYADAVDHGTASYELEAPSRGEMQRRIASLTQGGFPYIVAEDGDTVAGYAYAGPFRPRPAYRFIVEDSIYVAPDRKGRGLGQLLLRRLIDDATALGFRQMIAVIGDGSDESASVRLHARLGFRHCGTMQGSGFKHGRWLDTVFMQLPMNGGTDTLPDPDSLPERGFRSRP